MVTKIKCKSRWKLHINQDLDCESGNWLFDGSFTCCCFAIVHSSSISTHVSRQMDARGHLSARIEVPCYLFISLVCRYRKKDTREAAAGVEEKDLADNIGSNQLSEGNQESGDRLIFSNPLANGNFDCQNGLQLIMQNYDNAVRLCRWPQAASNGEDSIN